jgi:hypothetical protein
LGQAGLDGVCVTLQGYNEDIALEFTLNYRVEHSTVSGTHVEVTEETMAEVIGLPHIGERWYSQRTSQPEILRQFLEPGEALVKKGTDLTTGLYLIHGKMWFFVQ